MQEYDTEARIIRSSADAEASQLISDATAKYGPGLVVFRKIEAAQYIADQLKNNPNVSFIQANNTMNMLSLNKMRWAPVYKELFTVNY